MNEDVEIVLTNGHRMVVSHNKARLLVKMRKATLAEPAVEDPHVVSAHQATVAPDASAAATPVPATAPEPTEPEAVPTAKPVPVIAASKTVVKKATAKKAATTKVAKKALQADELTGTPTRTYRRRDMAGKTETK